MRGSTFLAVFLIVIGLMLVIAAFRGRAAQLLDALKSTAASGTVGSRPVQTTSAARRQA